MQATFYTMSVTYAVELDVFSKVVADVLKDALENPQYLQDEQFSAN